MFRYTKKSLVLEIVVIIATLIALLPFYLLIVTSLKNGDEILTTPAIAPPATPTLSNFAALLDPSNPSGNIIAGLLTSILITAATIGVLIGLGSTCAYVLARRTARWSTIAYYLFMIAIVLPTQLGVLPLYVGAQRLGLVGNPGGMILIYSGTLMPLAVFLYSGFFRRLPRDYEEAATIDGASRTQIFFRVILPLMSPATGTVAILGGLIVWNDFFTALIFLNGSAWQTLPVTMYNFVGSLVSQWNLIFALVLLSMIPILAFYVFAQKQFIQGYGGGLKA